MLETWKANAQRLKRETYALYLAYRDPRVPWYGKLFGACVVAYAFSPIDLIPDFIPVLGFLDDLVIVPLGIFLALKMIPVTVMEECRQRARDTMAQDKPGQWGAVVAILGMWAVAALIILKLLIH